MLRNNTEQIVIRPRLSSPAKAALTLAVLLAVAGLTVTAYRFGVNVADNSDTLARLQRDLDAEREHNRRLQESLAKAERQLGIDAAAYRELGTALAAANTQMVELESELKFYRSIIAPADGERGVKIQDFAVMRGAEPHSYQYKLVLIQALEHNRVVEGTVRLAIKGVRDAGPAELEVPDSPIAVKFKYFQNIEGSIELPAEFQPAEVIITLVIGAKKPHTTQRSFPWKAV